MNRAGLIVGLVLQATLAKADGRPATIKIGLPTLSGTAITTGASLLQQSLSSQLKGFAEVTLIDQDAAPLASLEKGLVDIAFVPASQLVSAGAKQFSSFELPFLLADIKDASSVEQSIAGADILGSLHAQGLVGLGYWNGGATRLVGAPVKSLDDLRGKTICLQTADSLSKPGTATSVSDSISTGTAGDILMAFGASAVASKIAGQHDIDLAKNCSTTSDVVEAAPIYIDQSLTDTSPSLVSASDFRPILFVPTMTEKSWDRLTTRMQEAIVRSANELSTKVSSISEYENSVALSNLKAKGFDAVYANYDDFFSKRGIWLKILGTHERNVIDSIIPVLELNKAVGQVPEKHGGLETSPPGSTANELLFATNRRDDNDLPEYRFAGAFADPDKVVYGSADLAIDAYRHVGEDVGSHIKLLDVKASQKDEFLFNLNERISKSANKEILIYIHGYNNSFKDAALSATALDSDLNFGGVTVLFSWPSNGELLRYGSDEQNVSDSRDDFLDFVRTLSNLQELKRIVVFAHSMGSRLPITALDIMHYDQSRH